MDTDDIFWIWILMYYIIEANRCLEIMEDEYLTDEGPLNEAEKTFADTFDRLYDKNRDKFKVNIRLSPKAFHKLFELVKGDLTKNPNRSSISAKCHLFLTLIYLAHGEDSQHLMRCFEMDTSTVHSIVKETCKVLWKKLNPIYLEAPKTKDWERISMDFEGLLGLPNCIGAVDGKFVNLYKGDSSSSEQSQEVQQTILIFGMCDANYKFTFVDIQTYWPQNDGSMFSKSEFGNRLLKGELDLPTPKSLPGRETLLPYYIVGTSAFPLRDNLMRPYPGKLLSNDKKIFNAQISRVGQLIENTFGIMTSRWKVLGSPICMHGEDAENIVKASVVLHNFATTYDSKLYYQSNFVDSERNGFRLKGLWRQEIMPLKSICKASSNNASRIAFDLRTTLKNYIVSDLMK